MKKAEEFLTIMILALTAFGWSESKNIPSCRVSMTVRVYGKVPKHNGDTIMILDKDSSIGLAVNITNKGKAEKFDLKLETQGLDVTDGSLSRNVTVETGKAGQLRLAVKGKDIGPECKVTKRFIRIIASPETQPKVVCGQTWKHFLCPPKKKAARK